jgi:hypothetical protein
MSSKSAPQPQKPSQSQPPKETQPSTAKQRKMSKHERTPKVFMGAMMQDPHLPDDKIHAGGEGEGGEGPGPYSTRVLDYSRLRRSSIGK